MKCFYLSKNWHDLKFRQTMSPGYFSVENAQGNMSLFFCDTRYAELSLTGEKQKSDIYNINMDVRRENILSLKNIF